MRRAPTCKAGTVITWPAMKILVLTAALLAQNAAARRPPPLVSPEVDAERRVTFRLRAPDAKKVVASGQFSREKVDLVRDGEGIWTATVGPVAPGLYEYSLSVDGVSMIDPANPHIKPMRAPRTSILEVPGDPPLVTEYQDVPHGTVRVHHYRSRTLGRVRRLHVYTPPDYDRKSAARYPTLYLQHGHGDNDATWTVHGRAHFVLDNLIARGAARPMVIVMMDGHAIPPEAVPAPERLGDNTTAFGRELVEEVIPFVQASYRVRPEAQARALVGLSMGGHQALSVGLAHPDTFAWVGSFSGAAPDAAALGPRLADPAALNRKLRWLWIGCGKEDFLLPRNEALIALLREKGVEHVWRLTEGGHSWPVWREYLAEVLPQLFAPAPRRRS